MLFFNLFPYPAFVNPLQGENGFCVLLGLTLIGVLAGWALLFLAPPRRRIPESAGLALVAVPSLYLSAVVVWFPSAERLVLVMPVLPLLVAGIFRTYFNARPSRQSSTPEPVSASLSD